MKAECMELRPTRTRRLPPLSPPTPRVFPCFGVATVVRKLKLPVAKDPIQGLSFRPQLPCPRRLIRPRFLWPAMPARRPSLRLDPSLRAPIRRLAAPSPARIYHACKLPSRPPFAASMRTTSQRLQTAPLRHSRTGALLWLPSMGSLHLLRMPAGNHPPLLTSPLHPTLRCLYPSLLRPRPLPNPCHRTVPRLPTGHRECRW